MSAVEYEQWNTGGLQYANGCEILEHECNTELQYVIMMGNTGTGATCSRLMTPLSNMETPMSPRVMVS